MAHANNIICRYTVAVALGEALKQENNSTSAQVMKPNCTVRRAGVESCVRPEKYQPKPAYKPPAMAVMGASVVRAQGICFNEKYAAPADRIAASRAIMPTTRYCLGVAWIVDSAGDGDSDGAASGSARSTRGSPTTSRDGR